MPSGAQRGKAWLRSPTRDAAQDTDSRPSRATVLAGQHGSNSWTPSPLRWGEALGIPVPYPEATEATPPAARLVFMLNTSCLCHLQRDLKSKESYSYKDQSRQNPGF